MAKNDLKHVLKNGLKYRTSVLEVLELIASDVRDVPSIAKITGKAESTIKGYRSQLGFSFYTNNVRIHTARKIQYAIDSGAQSIQEIAEITGKAESTIKGYRSRVSLPKKINKNRIYSENKIKEAFDSGAKSLEEISVMTGFSNQRIYKYKNVIDLPKKITIHPEWDLLIDERRSLPYMADKFNVTPEAIRQYMHRTGQHADWKKDRIRLRNQSSQK